MTKSSKHYINNISHKVKEALRQNKIIACGTREAGARARTLVINDCLIECLKEIEMLSQLSSVNEPTIGDGEAK